MANKLKRISQDLQSFIEKQKIFFVATAGSDGRVNLSPKGMDSLRVLGENKVLWLNLTGSGNETSAHLQENGRITLMFCALEGKPLILRLYGNGTVLHTRDAEWQKSIELFPAHPGARQIIEVDVELVQTSCGFAVPLYEYVADRDLLEKWASSRGQEGIEAYWEKENQVSMDGRPTNILGDEELSYEITKG